MRQGHPTSWRFRHRNAAGVIIWASGVGDIELAPGDRVHDRLIAELRADQPWTLNVFTDEGETDVLDVYLRAATAPTNFYLGLANTTIAETTTLASISEPSGNGYARQLIERSATGFPTLAASVATSTTETFTASGGTIGPVTDAFLATVASGTAGLLLFGSALSTTRTLADGESLDSDIAITAS